LPIGMALGAVLTGVLGIMLLLTATASTGIDLILLGLFLIVMAVVFVWALVKMVRRTKHWLI
jgi:uncharacterized membrane protein